MMNAAETLTAVVQRFGGRMVVEARLGQGAMGEVHRVRVDGQPFALKVLLPASLSSEDVLRRFLLEGRILRELRHPNLLAVHEVGDDPKCPYLLCDLVEGTGLDRIVTEQAPLPWARALDLIEGVLAGLACAHGRGIVHRDIKPSNVLIEADGRPRVADFGIAKASGMDALKTSTGLVMGTPAYIAPELVLGEAPTPAADVYSTGVMLFELITGKPPFEGDEVTTLLSLKVKTHAVPLASRSVSGVPPAIDRLIAMAMAREPIERLSTAAAFARELADTRRMIQTTAKGASTSTSAVKVQSRPDRSTGRIVRPAVNAVPAEKPPVALRPWGIGVAIAALVLGAATLSSWRRPPPPPRRVVTPDRATPVADLTAAELALRDALVESTSPTELERRLAQAAAMPRGALLLHEAWRRTDGSLRARIGAALGAQSDARAVPALIEQLAADPSGDDSPRVAAAKRLAALIHGDAAPDPGECPEPDVQVSRLCTLLKKACVPGRGESPEPVRAAVRALGWLKHPDTACIEDLVRAPGCAAWVGDGLADDPAKEARGALQRIGTKPAVKQLELMGY